MPNLRSYPNSNDETGKSHIGSSGNRIATVLFYLGSPEEGGETIFPNAEGSPVNITTHETKGGSIEVKANAGDAVLFWDYTPDNKPDPRSLHGGKPVLSVCLSSKLNDRRIRE